MSRVTPILACQRDARAVTRLATLGLARAEDTNALMVKATGQLAWPEGEVDLLGHLF